ncbi:MAG: inositol monophosphatase [Planctomycetaceae bacterium]|jgi:myo-inositol-1(or 4)-monophosphatase|nr:inositol monophosphatase [Planctomycetaceae bacterium]
MASSTSYLSVCEQAAKAGGSVLREMLGTVSVKHKKNRFDLVTEADVAAQNTIKSIVLGAFPDHQFLGEESTAEERTNAVEAAAGREAAKRTWIVDPLDGTTNYVHGVPLFCTSIALAEGNDLLCGVIYNPLTEELYRAEKGGGAFLNGNPVHTSSWTTLGESLASVSFPTLMTPQTPDYLAFQKAVLVCQAIRRTGSTALNLAFTAAGRFDATWAFSCHPWDIAAGTLLVQEAGGIVRLPNGVLNDPSPVCACANEFIDRELETVLGKSF